MFIKLKFTKRFLYNKQLSNYTLRIELCQLQQTNEYRINLFKVEHII